MIEKDMTMSVDFKKGDRVECIEMPNDPCPIEPGTLGTVTEVLDMTVTPFFYTHKIETEVHVNWDNGRTLHLLLPLDKAKVIK